MQTLRTEQGTLHEHTDLLRAAAADSDTPAKPAGKAAAAGRKPAAVKPIAKAAKGITRASQRSAKSRVLSGKAPSPPSAGSRRRR